MRLVGLFLAEQLMGGFELVTLWSHVDWEFFLPMSQLKFMFKISERKLKQAGAELGQAQYKTG